MSQTIYGLFDKYFKVCATHSVPSDFFSATSNPLWNYVRNKYVSVYIILHVVVVLMLFYEYIFFVHTRLFPTLGAQQNQLGSFKNPDAQASLQTN